MQRERSSTSSSPGGEAGICIEVGAGDCEEEEAVPEGPGGPERIFSQSFEAVIQRQQGGASVVLAVGVALWNRMLQMVELRTSQFPWDRILLICRAGGEGVSSGRLPGQGGVGVSSV